MDRKARRIRENNSTCRRDWKTAKKKTQGATREWRGGVGTQEGPEGRTRTPKRLHRQRRKAPPPREPGKRSPGRSNWRGNREEESRGEATPTIRQDTAEPPRGRRESERRARMEVSGSSTLKLQGTVKTRQTGTRRQAEERARKTTQSPGQSRRNGLGGRHGKTEELDPTTKAGESNYWMLTPPPPPPPEDLRDTNRHLTKKNKEARTRGSTAPKIDTAAYKDSPQMEEGLDQ